MNKLKKLFFLMILGLTGCTKIIEIPIAASDPGNANIDQSKPYPIETVLKKEKPEPVQNSNINKMKEMSHAQHMNGMTDVKGMDEMDGMSEMKDMKHE